MTDQTLNRRLFLGLTGSGLVTGALALASGVMSSSASAASYEVSHTPADWRRRLGAARFNILRNAGTEAPFTSPLNKEHRKGVFACAGCALPLFASTTKFDSGTGWPSFYAALPNALRTNSDRAFGIARTEEHCRRCGGHLGHIFDDGPRPTGKRHCINGLALTFRPV
ncbi:MAG: peptide-methionine (R)-S-oxide reductase MsrB [Sphingomonas sp.]|uniref:peptide-methionine (R)-S-oxide reductase MsrB n=1 Tax=Sphingomonas sp. TaxID=28214 RepID=UPI0018122337|nr:peptide-methionine (R)-S-oxide reductase MsrB [Sphingomonas sp.]MBA3668393.1 peptide-methionine (R)-S-oxide reductase MsrB [Sphingomonas sp.]